MAAMRAAKHAWSNVHSDLLTNLRLIGAFDHVPAGEAQLQFCQVTQQRALFSHGSLGR
jgi:hypothetical protein